jgi:hypothetical protein
MLRRFGLALLAIASLAGGARAQSVDVPKALGQLRGGIAEEGIDLARSEVEARLTPYPCPPCPSRAGSSERAVGGATARPSSSGARKTKAAPSAKGFVGGGWLNDGSLDDEDFLVGQIKFKDIFSRIQGNSLVYGTIDLGQDFTLLDGATKVTVGPFAGFNFWQETQVGYGARCNRDDVDGAVCGPPAS